MMLLPDPHALRRAERELRDTAERARGLKEARAAAMIPVRDLPPEVALLIPRPPARAERPEAELGRSA
jgi:hypothetical protein